MRLAPEEALELAARAVGLVPTDAAEAVVTSGDSALTRFAGNRIHQNVAEIDTQLTVRAIVGQRRQRREDFTSLHVSTTRETLN